MDKYQTAILKHYQLKQEIDLVKTKIGNHLALCAYPSGDDENFIPCLTDAYSEIKYGNTMPGVLGEQYINDHCCPDCIKAHAEIQKRKKLRLSLGRAKGELTKLGKELSKAMA